MQLIEIDRGRQSIAFSFQNLWAVGFLFILPSLAFSQNLQDAPGDSLSAHSKCLLGAGAGTAIIVSMMLLLLVTLSLTIAGLRKSGSWSLSDALSEETEPETTTANATAAGPVVTTKKVPNQVASASRLIAFVGMQVILAIYLGIGITVVWHFANTGEVPDLSKIVYFLASGSAIFAPYIANQAQSAFSNLLK